MNRKTPKIPPILNSVLWLISILPTSLAANECHLSIVLDHTPSQAGHIADKDLCSSNLDYAHNLVQRFIHGEDIDIVPPIHTDLPIAINDDDTSIGDGFYASACTSGGHRVEIWAFSARHGAHSRPVNITGGLVKPKLALTRLRSYFANTQTPDDPLGTTCGEV